MDLHTVEQIERAIDALTPQQRDELYSWFDRHYLRPVDVQSETAAAERSSSVVAEMRALRSHVKPDPEGWTTRDYVNYGRH